LSGRPFNGFLWQLNYGYTHAQFKEYQRSPRLIMEENSCRWCHEIRFQRVRIIPFLCDGGD
jgi:hypothetical protein